MEPPAKKSTRKFTYHDYQTWQDEKRWEIVDGKAYDMTPTPSVAHPLTLNA